MWRMSRRLWIPIVAVAALALLGSAGAYVYFFSGLRTSPPSLALASPGASPATDASANAGTWQIATGSVVGYRVKEQFVGQASSHEAVDRTDRLLVPDDVRPNHRPAVRPRECGFGRGLQRDESRPHRPALARRELVSDRGVRSPERDAAGGGGNGPDRDGLGSRQADHPRRDERRHRDAAAAR